eukprot:7671-Chlamydomonas_euryale.AAC.11
MPHHRNAKHTHQAARTSRSSISALGGVHVRISELSFGASAPSILVFGAPFCGLCSTPVAAHPEKDEHWLRLAPVLDSCIQEANLVNIDLCRGRQHLCKTTCDDAKEYLFRHAACRQPLPPLQALKVSGAADPFNAQTASHGFFPCMHDRTVKNSRAAMSSLSTRMRLNVGSTLLHGPHHSEYNSTTTRQAWPWVKLEHVGACGVNVTRAQRAAFTYRSHPSIPCSSAFPPISRHRRCRSAGAAASGPSQPCLLFCPRRGFERRQNSTKESNTCDRNPCLRERAEMQCSAARAPSHNDAVWTASTLPHLLVTATEARCAQVSGSGYVSAEACRASPPPAAGATYPRHAATHRGGDKDGL